LVASPSSSASSASSSQLLFDVEPFRTEPRRALVAREVAHPTLVLGSTQPPELVAPRALRARSVELVRRRGGGGAVYLEPGNHLWLDAWIPRDDPLWSPDVSVAAEWVGRWWVAALGGLAVGLGPTNFSIHAGRAVPGRLGELVCFAGRGPGEVFDGERKVVGLSQWRSREGALFSSCAYASWEPGPLLELLEVDGPSRAEVAEELTGAALGLGALLPPEAELSSVRARLVGSFPGFALGGDGA
jgi:lipoate-protein ligase A